MSLRLVFTVAAIICATPSQARADAAIPSCRGHNPKAAAAARAEGLRHYRASKREGHDDAEMTSALGFFDAACAAGDDGALELRAYALAGVERFVEAAQTLDAFLVGHPLDTLPAETRARIAAQQPAILSRVASLSIETDIPGANVSINHQPAGVTPLHAVRLAPGRYDVEVSGEGIGTITRSLDLAPGDRTERIAPGAPIADATAPPAPGPGVAKPGSGPARSSLKPLAIGAAAGGGVLLLGGIAGAIWQHERISYYDSNNCVAESKAGCSSTLSQSHDARGIEVAGFVGAGALAAASAVLFYLDHKRSERAGGVGWRTVSCTIPGAGVSCLARF